MGLSEPFEPPLDLPLLYSMKKHCLYSIFLTNGPQMLAQISQQAMRKGSYMGRIWANRSYKTHMGHIYDILAHIGPILDLYVIFLFTITFKWHL